MSVGQKQSSQPIVIITPAYGGGSQGGSRGGIRTSTASAAGVRRGAAGGSTGRGEGGGGDTPPPPPSSGLLDHQPSGTSGLWRRLHGMGSLPTMALSRGVLQFHLIVMNVGLGLRFQVRGFRGQGGWTSVMSLSLKSTLTLS